MKLLPTLLPEWRILLRKAWSMRLMLLAGLLTGAEAVINLVGVERVPGLSALPAWLRALVVLVVIAAAYVARLLPQRGLDDPR